MEIGAVEGSGLSKKIFVVPQHHAQKKPVKICWTFGDGKQDCNEYSTTYTGYYNINHTYTKAGEYKTCIRVVYADGCVAEKCDIVTVKKEMITSVPKCNVKVDETTRSKVDLYRSFVIVPTFTRQPEKICLRFGDGTDSCYIPSQPFINESSAITHLYPAPGVYRFTIVVWFTGGCIAEQIRQVKISDRNEKPRLHLSPNPATTVLHAQFSSVKQEQVTVYIFNVNGVLLKSFEKYVDVGVNNWTIDVSSLPSGVYSMVVRSPNQLVSTIFLR
jgi:hypothetical protein